MYITNGKKKKKSLICSMCWRAWSLRELEISTGKSEWCYLKEPTFLESGIRLWGVQVRQITWNVPGYAGCKDAMVVGKRAQDILNTEIQGLSPASFLSFFFLTFYFILEYSLVAQTVKHLPTMQETWVQSLGREDPLEKEMATHSSILEDPGRLPSIGSQRVRHNWATSLIAG